MLFDAHFVIFFPSIIITVLFAPPTFLDKLHPRLAVNQFVTLSFPVDRSFNGFSGDMPWCGFNEYSGISGISRDTHIKLEQLQINTRKAQKNSPTNNAVTKFMLWWIGVWDDYNRLG